ncbi:MAG: PAS domain S-box protein [Betaproteobacteria bacterium]
MNIHRKIIALVGIGMLLFLAIMVLSLNNVMSSFSSIIAEVDSKSENMRRIRDIVKEMDIMSTSVRDYLAGKDSRYRDAYLASRASARKKVEYLMMTDAGAGGRVLSVSLRLDLKALDERANRIFTFTDPTGKDRVRAEILVNEIDGILSMRKRDVENHINEERAAQTNKLADYFYFLRNRVLLLFLLVLLTSFGFLLGFGFYLHRKVAVPLKDLWRGAAEISQGNLDYQIQLQGAGDIAQLAGRFNEMALKLKRSHIELEEKLLDRTNELAAIDAVALTLSQAASLKEMLSRSLNKILESLVGLEPRGGVFLCHSDGETLRLVAHKGLPPLFVEQEETIRMGECLCGMVAETGEILYTEKGCVDARHTRSTESRAHSHIIIPVKSRGIVLGVIFLYPQKDFTLKSSDLQMLETIGNQLGMAVENLRFYAEVKESSEKFWDLFENSRDILFTIDTAGTLTAVNKAAEKFSDCTKSELVGKSILDFLTPGGVETAKRMLRGEGVTARQVIEFEVIKGDGSRAFIEMGARRLFRQHVPVGYQISARDMTEQKLMREKLLKAERLGAIGEIVITVRHEINNPLTTIIGNIELLIERYGDRDKHLAERLQTILNNALRIAEIVKQLQTIKRDKVVEYVKGVTMTDLKQE